MSTPAATQSKIPSIAVNESFIQEFTCSARTVRVDYKQIKATSNTIFGTGKALGWGCKFGLHGMKLKPDDYIKVKGEIQTAEQYTAIIKGQKGYQEKTGGGIDKISDKSLVSAKRLVRAFASEITFLINKGLPLPEETKQLAKEANLPEKYAFLDAAYGMTDADIRSNWESLYSFAKLFDKIIDAAYKSDYVSGSKKYSHADALVNYVQFRGITTSD